MGWSTDVSKSSNPPKTFKDFVDTSYDTPELKVEHLLKRGFTPEQATAWARKLYIKKMFELNKRKIIE